LHAKTITNEVPHYATKCASLLKYKAEKNESGLTALGGLPVYLDLIRQGGGTIGQKFAAEGSGLTSCYARL
jgi:hypothetical protein